MATVLTLCEICRNEYADMFTVKSIVGETTTEKKKHCEKCGKKFSSSYDLRQYYISGKVRKR